MKDIAIFGAGGFGREVACLIRRINEYTSEPVWNLIGFFDDNEKLHGEMISHFGKCLGGTDSLNSYSDNLAVVMAIGSSIVVKKVLDKINNGNVYYPNLINPDFRIGDPETFKIGKGNIISWGCSVTTNVQIGDFNVLNGTIGIGHDDVIGDFNTFMPAVRISGETKIGDFNFFGVGSIVLQRMKIGNHIRLGAGSVLMTKPKDGFLYMGNPARKTEL